MNIYRVTRTDEPGWDEYCGLVVYARSPRHARQVARDGISHPEDTWKDDSYIKVDYLGKAKVNATPKVLLEDFKAG